MLFLIGTNSLYNMKSYLPFFCFCSIPKKQCERTTDGEPTHIESDREATIGPFGLDNAEGNPFRMSQKHQGIP
jgi:hypothetical protein